MTAVLTILALLSGCCALAYEILYMRALTTLLGDTLYVHAALLSTFLVGIGLGAKLAHRWLRWLWLMEILTGAYALAFPATAAWLSDSAALAPATSVPALTILATVGFLAAPSLLVGFSIPLFSAYIKARAADQLAFQGVYKAYNLGALLSVLSVELLLVRHLGVSRALTAVGAINVLNGAVLLWMGLAPSRPPEQAARRFPPSIVIALFLASFASAVFQLFFLKLSFLVFSPHRENFAVALSVTMLGITLGAWLASRFPVRFETLLAVLPLLIGIVYVNYRPLLDLYVATADWARRSELLVLVHKLAVGCLFALPPMIAWGALLPSLMRSEREVAGESGHLLWISSVANAVGYLAYVLLGHPWLGTAALLAAVAGLSLAASALASRGRWPRARLAAAAAGIVLVATTAWRWEERSFYLAQWQDDLRPKDQVLVFKSGPDSATLLRSSDYEWISYNGHPSVHAQRDGVVDAGELMSGVVPALGAPRLDRALVLGLGTGITAGATSRIFRHTDVVEINNAFFKMLPELAHVNLDVEHNPAASLHLADGRSFLVGREGAYDAIVNSIPAPTYFSASKIYTLEFYERVARALGPGGVFCTWLAVPNMSEQGTMTVLSALRRSFDHCDLRLLGLQYYMATCSDAPVRPRRFEELPAQPVLVEVLRRSLAGFELDEFFEDHRISENIFEHFEPRVERENTDEHPVLEFMVVRNYQLGTMGSELFLDRQDLMNIDPVRRHELADPARLVRRAAVFHRLGPGYFRKNFQPLIDGDLSATIEWRLRLRANVDEP